jgi:putative IMPACT (imprinted ancient) family translation regulator
MAALLSAVTDRSDDSESHPESFRTVAGPGEASFEVKGSEFIGYASPANTVEEAESFIEQVRERHPDATHNVPAYRVPASAGSPSRPSDADSVGSDPGSTGSDADPTTGPRDAIGPESGSGVGTEGSGNEVETGTGPENASGTGTAFETGPMLREYQSDDGEPSGSSGKPALNVLVQRDIRNVVTVVTRYYGGTNLGVGGLARAYSRAVKDAVDDARVVETVPHERFVVTVEYDDSGTVRGLLESSGVEFEGTYAADVTFEVRAPVDAAATLRDRIRSATSGRADIDT